MALLPEIEKRISSQSFLPTPLTKDEIADLIEAARLSPSAKNRQSWRFVVMTRRDLLDRVAEACYGQEHVQQAPCVIACCTTNIDYKMPNGQLSYPVDLGIASAFMMLQASHLGLSSCPISIFDEEKVKSILTIPSLMKVVLLVCVGHSDQIPPTRNRLPTSRIASENRW